MAKIKTGWKILLKETKVNTKTSNGKKEFGTNTKEN